MFRSLLLIAFLSVAGLLHAQGVVRGKVTDPRGESLIGATIVLKDDPGTGTTTDLDGNFSLRIDRAGPTTIVVAFVSFESQELVVAPKNGEVVVANFELAEKNIELKQVEVVAKARRSGDAYLERMKVNSATNVDFISKDVMARTGDGDAASAVKRITGVSTVGSFVTVRGLADRYIVNTINGSRVPTLDPFTNNLRLDIFPTGLLDNIVITKTASPDLPGDWSGAYLSMNTSDYPSRLTVNIATALGYNPNTSYKKIVSASTSSTDLLGWDDGSRDIPDGIPEDVEDYPTFVNPDLYQQLVVLGLQSWLDHYGITATTPGFSSTTVGTNSTLQHLALVELDLLPPALLNDANAVQVAVDAYNSTYDLPYFSPILNADLAALNTKWDNSHWRVGETTADPNYNISLSIGNQLELFKKRKETKQLGYLFGFRYMAETQYDAASTIERSPERYEDENPGDIYTKKGDQKIGQVSNGWNALGNLSFKLNRNNSFTLMAMANLLGQNNARYLQYLQPGINSSTFVSEDQFYEQRRLWVFQYGSKHVIPALDLTVNADVSYSTGKRDILDMKSVKYILPPPGQPITDVDGALGQPGRIYRYLNEDMLDTRLGIERPLTDDPKRPKKLKFGGAYQHDERTNDQKYYSVLGAPGPTHWEDPGQFELGPDGRFPSRYVPYGSFKDNDIGILEVWAGYAMVDLALTHRLRLVAGVRAEHTDLISDIRRFYELHIASDDTIRGTVGDVSINGALSPEPKPARPGRIDQWDILPSANLIYKLRDREDAPMNLRLSYFRSLGRPSFREFSVVQYYDYLLQATIYGNPDLRMTQIDNADIRVEYFLKNGDNISLSGFYKHFKDHIELLQSAGGGFTWRNANTSHVYGLELEGKFRIVRGLEWRGNLTLMTSESELTFKVNGEDRNYATEMYGQAPYIVNSMLSYGLDSLRLSFGISYNVQGPKLAVTNSEVAPDAIRAYEMPRHLIDLSVNKRFGKHWGVLFRVRDLLNAPHRRSYRFASGYDLDFDKYTYGTEYILTLSYSIR
ncbi:MAG: TonB-dependent receptor [Flavobacteriales bacterium]|nr:TonB-dependent receptor [Flavobacteriales bacterium]MCB9192942.1 TonB-dependent receptor [Flavobacteriales bacterium]